MAGIGAGHRLLADGAPKDMPDSSPGVPCFKPRHHQPGHRLDRSRPPSTTLAAGSSADAACAAEHWSRPGNSDAAPLRLPCRSLAGYLKFPGAWPVVRTGLKYRKRPKVAERFVPRESKGWGVGTGEAGRDPSRPGPKVAEVTPGEAEAAVSRAPSRTVNSLSSGLAWLMKMASRVSVVMWPVSSRSRASNGQVCDGHQWLHGRQA